MGQEIKTSQFKLSDFEDFKMALQQESTLLGEWFDGNFFSRQSLVSGYELEAWLISQDYYPSPSNEQFLANANSPLLTQELAQFNIELNSVPLKLDNKMLSECERAFTQHWKFCQQTAKAIDCQLLSIGILPSLKPDHLTMSNISNQVRYRALNEQVLRQRDGELFKLNISGHESIKLTHRDVMLEAASTSLQIHLQVTQEQAIRYYNASILLSAPMVAISANSPFLFGKDLWAETRIPVFEQSVDVGGYAGAAHGPVHRVSFGTAYARNTLMECFEENIQHFPVLLPMNFESEVNAMKHLSLHNGTIWRWNRPLIGFDDDGTPHLRIEHRVIPSGPSIVDNVANMAFYYGLVFYYANMDMPAELQLEFSLARDNFYTAAQHGLDNKINWPGCNRCSIRHLILHRLLDEAESGLRSLGMDEKDIEKYLKVIEARTENKQTGSEWQRKFVKLHGRDMNNLTRVYYRNQQTGEAVHNWDYVGDE